LDKKNSIKLINQSIDQSGQSVAVHDAWLYMVVLAQN